MHICICVFIYKMSDFCSLIFKYFLWMSIFLSFSFLIWISGSKSKLTFLNLFSIKERFILSQHTIFLIHIWIHIWNKDMSKRYTLISNSHLTHPWKIRKLTYQAAVTSWNSMLTLCSAHIGVLLTVGSQHLKYVSEGLEPISLPKLLTYSHLPSRILFPASERRIPSARRKYL